MYTRSRRRASIPGDRRGGRKRNPTAARPVAFPPTPLIRDWLAEPYLRCIDPAQYKALNPPWLAEAAAVASSPAPPDRDADAALPPPARQAVLQLREAAAAGEAAAQLGHAVRRSLFLLEEGTTYLNHGSYGAVLRPALEAQRYFQVRLFADRPAPAIPGHPPAHADAANAAMPRGRLP